MTYLGDLIGHFLAELTIGRTQADIESVRIAELYANHPFLKHFPVPRFRLPNITLEIPVAIVDIETPKGKEPRGKLDSIPKLIATIEGTVRSHLEKKDVKLSKDKYGELKNRMSTNITELTKIKEVPISITHIADKLVSEVTRTVREANEKKFQPDSPETNEIKRRLLFDIRRDLLEFMEAPPRLRVLATTKDLSEIKEPDRLVRMRLTVSEEGLEWTVIELEGKPQDRLVPE